MSLSDDHHRLSVEAPAAAPSLSPSSSLSSLMSAGSILPAPPSNSSQSDIIYMDSSDSKSFMTKSSQYSASRDALAPTPRSPSRAENAQRPSRVLPTPLRIPPINQSQTPAAPPRLSTSQKLKRAFGGRRKKSDGSALVSSQTSSPANRGGDAYDNGLMTAPAFGAANVGYPLSRVSSSAKQFTFQLSSTFDALRGKRTPSSASSSSMSLSVPNDTPPPPPAKSATQITPISGQGWPTGSVYGALPSSPTVALTPAANYSPRSHNMAPVIAQDAVSTANVSIASPKSASALPPSFDKEGAVPRQTKLGRSDEIGRNVEDWRKSDSTVRTVRLVTSRSPSRPLSVAESSHSGHTVVPGLVSPSSKRVSAFLMDADFVTPEAESETEEEEEMPVQHIDSSQIVAPPAEEIKEEKTEAQQPAHVTEVASISTPELRVSGPSPSKGVNRRSMSLNMGMADLLNQRNGVTSYIASSTGPSDAPQAEQRRVTDPTARTKRSATMVTSDDDGAASIASHSTGRNIRGRIAAWTQAAVYYPVEPSGSTLSAPVAEGLREFPRTDRSRSPAQVPNTHHSKGLRQNVSNGLARLGRAWSGGTNSPLSAAATGQTASADRLRGRASEDKKHHFSRGGVGLRSTGSSSDAESLPPQPTGPNLGKLVRQGKHGVTGLVFGCQLADCVKNTAVDCGEGQATGLSPSSKKSGFGMDLEIVGGKALEGRRLPALVFRCAQHLEKWGVQEEGLFRISGRASHITVIRTEFDSGADYDMSDCGPGELDPHAVASVFKAYLRELPDTLLTRKLSPYFDAAMIAENSGSPVDDNHAKGMKGTSKLGPGLRKPPSLSTFALPVLSSKAPSSSLLNSLAELIARLPQENRDLLRTVTELIKITARRNKETKMPMSNLLLIFCPSLQMSPPLLRVLCEGEGIWNGPPKVTEDEYQEEDSDKDDNSVLDIGSESASSVEAGFEKADPTTEVVNDDAQLNDNSNVEEDLPKAIPRPQKPGASQRDTVHTLIIDEETLREGSPFRLSDPERPSELHDHVKLASELDGQIPFSNKVWAPPLLTSSSSSLSSSTTTSEDSGEDDVAAGASKRRASFVAPARIARPAPPAVKTDTRHRRSSTLLSKFSTASISRHSTATGSTIQFPASGSAPVTPVTRRSMLAFPGHASSPDFKAEPNSADQTKRMRKPSLQLLLRKRSISSLLLRSTPSTPSPQSSQSYMSMQSNIPPVPPLLEVHLAHAPLKLGMGLDEAEDTEKGMHQQLSSKRSILGSTLEENEAPLTAGPTGKVQPAALSIPDTSNTEFSRGSSNSSTYPATLYYTPRTTLRDSSAPGMSSRATSTYSLMDFSLASDAPEEAEEDWAQSVLLAADAGIRLEGQVDA